MDHVEPDGDAFCSAPAKVCPHRRTESRDDLIVEMCEYYPRYVREFELMLAITPAEDRAAVQLLLDHEVALVATAVGVRAGRSDALAPVEQYLATATSPR